MLKESLESQGEDGKDFHTISRYSEFLTGMIQQMPLASDRADYWRTAYPYSVEAKVCELLGISELEN